MAREGGTVESFFTGLRGGDIMMCEEFLMGGVLPAGGAGHFDRLEDRVMLSLALVCLGLAALGPAESRSQPSADDLKAYEAAKARAGPGASAQVDLALWCEARGLRAERDRHLARAVLIEPANARARGLMGQVADGGRWTTPEALAGRLAADDAAAATLAEYNRRRDELQQHPGRRAGWAARKERARAHARLALWCESVGLKGEATAHFTSAVVLDPYNEATWKNLGYVKHDGRWVSREQAAAERTEAEAQRQADHHWEPLLRKLRAWLGERTKHSEAEARLGEVTDPRAVPSIVRVFGGAGDAGQATAVRLLARVDAPVATRRLADLALFARAPDVRAAATGALRGREPRDYAGALVDMIRSPLRCSVLPVRGPGRPGALLVEGPRFRMERRYDAPAPFQLGSNFYGYVGYDGNGLPVVARGVEVSRLEREKPDRAARDLAALEARTASMIAEANLKAEFSRQRFLADYQAVETYNEEAAERNARVVPVLAGALDAPAELAEDENAWHVWWYDRIGYRYEPPPQVTISVNASPQLPPPLVISCFVAGTPVRTLDGRMPIETLAVGDRVLSQDVTTGVLGVQPVLVVHHNPAGATIQVELDSGETVTASVYHRFWRAGRGWAMARELQAGDVVRTLAGTARVASVSPGPTEPLFNLDVAGSRTYFVGKGDALVHDNTLPDPHATPFDAPATTTAGVRER